MKNRDRVYLENILDSIHSIFEYTSDLNEQAFYSKKMVQDAVIRNFEIIGEATKLLSDSLRTEHDHIPWKNMAGMRDKLIHNYMGVDLEAVWQTIDDILPSLEKEIQLVLKSFS